MDYPAETLHNINFACGNMLSALEGIHPSAFSTHYEETATPTQDFTYPIDSPPLLTHHYSNSQNYGFPIHPSPPQGKNYSREGAQKIGF
ncbi:putative frizzled-7-A [Sesbania bispinosa]|nr:putative frizzled-7-A [Sesbania bispinosa]